jgi:deazaflavin-dependent oxidoreductase (nitroreductase family)
VQRRNRREPVGRKDLLLFTTTGLRSGKPRVSPLFYFTINEKVIIVGSYRGADTDPQWVRNLRADPRAHIEVRTTDYDVIARELPAAERDELYPRIVAIAPNYGEYEANTSRVIALFELLRVMFCPGAGEPRIEVIEPPSEQENRCTVPQSTGRIKPSCSATLTALCTTGHAERYWAGPAASTACFICAGIVRVTTAGKNSARRDRTMTRCCRSYGEAKPLPDAILASGELTDRWSSLATPIRMHCHAHD